MPKPIFAVQMLAKYFLYLFITINKLQHSNFDNLGISLWDLARMLH